MKKLLLSTIALVFSVHTFGQGYQYESSNYANPNDTFTVSAGNTATLFLTNADTTGENIAWDFSKISPITQKPFFYDDPMLLSGYKDQYANQVCKVSTCQTNCLFTCATVYNPFTKPTEYATCVDTCKKGCKTECDNDWLALTNLAKPLLDSIYTPVGIAITDFYQFLENDNSSLKNTAVANTVVAFGLEVPMLVRYDNPDVIYSYPVTFGKKDSSTSSFKYDVETATYGLVPFVWKHWQKRNNEVVGWGKIKTPFGEYDSTYKVRSLIYSVDTVFAAQDTFSYGTTLGLSAEQFPDSVIEYTWLSVRSGYPVVRIKSMYNLGIEVPITLEYLDSTRCFTPVPVFIPNPPLAYQNENDSAHIQFYSIPVNTDSLHWDFGDPASGVENISDKWNPIHYYTTKGTFQVQLVTCNTLCDTCTTLKIPVKVTDSTEVMADFNYKAAFPCLGDSVRFTNISQRSIAWEWSFDDGTPISTLRNPAHLFSDTGAYNVRLVAWDSTMTMTDTLIKTVTVNPKPVPDFSIGDSITHKNILLTNLSTNTVENSFYFWTILPNLLGGAVPTKYSGTEKDAVFNFDKAGKASVSLMVTNTLGCSAIKTKKVTIKECLQAIITSSATSVCSGETVTFKNESFSDFNNPILYYWLKDGVNVPMVTDSAYTMNAAPGTSAKYVFQLVGDNGMCIDTGTVVINVKKTLKLNAGSDTTLCIGDSVQLSASGGPITFPKYRWEPVQGLSCVDCAKPYAKPTDSMMYVLTLSVLPVNTCYMWDSMRVNVNYGAPVADIEWEFYQISSDSAIVIVKNISKNGGSSHWIFMDGKESFEKNTLDTFSCWVLTNVKLIVKNSCGTDSISETYDVICEGISENFSLRSSNLSEINIFPNPFSDYLTVNTNSKLANGVKLELIDKFGRIVLVENKNQSGNLNGFNVSNATVKTLSPGIYLLRITTDGVSKWGKVVKME
ncbi:MAG: hypothetical protein A3H98_14470 [Bacteroidetes bacterium RIFCSPLOWO2_02_FULL_36_8]|nr:MAG: hypothetical protein A3H98_14470 [Bacteroidetes bacterium RIFCSPLOWO2_02_FULL_36_8]OFY71844.1 MAG: hypothetical protein A3G23_04775 [Bacteroidetes bacterium RIFCSPLOWO2_12_FULL_37_12]